MLTTHFRRRALTGEAGMTIVEMIIALAAGLVVTFAAFALIDVVTRVSNKVTDRVDATQRGRVWMEQFVEELNSGCLAGDVSPVQASSAPGLTRPSGFPANVVLPVSSDGTDLVFISGVGQGSSSFPTEHVVTYANRTLYDISYPFDTAHPTAGGGAPATLTTPATWMFLSTPSAARVLTNVDPTGTFFKYFSYSNPSNPSANSLVGAAALAPLPLSSTWPAGAITNAAYSVAEVDISWKVGPSNGSTESTRASTMNDSVVFRVTPANPSQPNYPCD